MRQHRFDLRAALSAAAPHEPEKLTLAELVRAYSLASLTDADYRLRKWLDAFGEQSAWAVASEQLEQVARAMLESGKYSAASINRDLSALGSVYIWAREKRKAPAAFQSPTARVRRFPEPIRRVHVEAEQLDALKAVARTHPDVRFGVFVALLVDSGARKGEILDRYGREFDLDRREILAPTTKNGTPRVLFFSGETATLIKRVLPKLAPDHLVFEGTKLGQPLTFRRAWADLTRDIGRPDLHMHDVRHAAAARLLRGGTTLAVAAQVLGHDPAVLARRYGHLETESLRRAQEQAWRAPA